MIFMVKKERTLPEKSLIAVELDRLKLDLANVRYQHMGRVPTEAEMEKRIWDEDDTGKLYDQIKSAKGLYEKPIIDSHFNVLEGNRRVVCLRRLRKEAHEKILPGIEPNKFDKILCEQLGPDTTQEQIRLLLAAIHVKGKKPWPTFNRAKQIYELHNEPYNKSFDYLALHLGMGKSTVIRFVRVYEETDKYGKRYGEDKEWYNKFTYFDELFKKRDLKEFGRVQTNVDKFADWVYQGKFNNDVRYVRYLPQVLEDKDALRAFDSKDIETALVLLNSKNPALKSREFKKISELISLIQQFPRREILKTANDVNRRKLLEKLRGEVDRLLKDLDSLKMRTD